MYVHFSWCCGTDLSRLFTCWPCPFEFIYVMVLCLEGLVSMISSIPSILIILFIFLSVSLQPVWAVLKCITTRTMQTGLSPAQRAGVQWISRYTVVSTLNPQFSSCSWMPPFSIPFTSLNFACCSFSEQLEKPYIFPLLFPALLGQYSL